MNIGISPTEKTLKGFLLEINSLKKYIENLQIIIRDLKTKNAELNRRNISLIEVEHINEKLFEEKKSLKNTIENLEKELLKTIKEKKNEVGIVENRLELEVNFYKGIRDTGLAKIDAAEKIIKLNEIQHNYILKIEKEIEELKNANDAKMAQLMVEHENNYNKLKKKMIDFIKKSKKDMEKSNISNIELYSKFSTIFKNQILNELENQSKQIIELIKEKEKQDKKIYALTEEIIVHHSVEKILKNKENKYKKIINDFKEDKIKEKEEKENINTYSNRVNSEINKNNNNEKDNYNEEKYYSEDKIKKNKIKNMKKNYDYDNNEGIFKTVMQRKEFNDYLSLDKEYKLILKKYQILKDQFNTLKDKEKLFQKKYYGIIKLYKIALDDLVKDEELTKKKIYINLDNINKGSYESFTKEEKIKIVQLLIKHLLPLIKVQNRDISKLREEFFDFDIKMNSTQQLSKVNGHSRNHSLYNQNYNNFRNITEDSNYNMNKENKFMKILENNKINKMFVNEDSNSFKSSFWGLNFNNNNNLVKNKEEKEKLNYNKTNGFLCSAKNLNRNKKEKKIMSEIKLNKRGILGEKFKYRKSPLLRFMYIQNIKSENQRNNFLNNKNFST